MEKLHANSVNNGLSGISRVFTLLIIFILSAVQKLQAQTAESGPSIDNLKKNSAAATAELEKIKHDEFMSYVYMSLGFAVVIVIAWTTTVMARKRSKREQEERQRFVLRQQELGKHSNHGHAHAHGLHKARRLFSRNLFFFPPLFIGGLHDHFSVFIVIRPFSVGLA